MLYLGILIALVAGVVTWAVTPAVIRIAGRIGAVDRPDGRKMHTRPMPRIGGVAVFAGFISGLLVGAALTGVLFDVAVVSVYWRGLALAAAALFVVGLIDDLRGLSFQWKFAAQIAASMFVWFAGFRILEVSNPFGDPIQLGLWSLPVTVLWIVAITNGVNLIDGLDGLATGIALISTITVAALAYYRSELGVTAASVALAGSLAGFLRFNFNPARIFLGDSGSLFLGFVLAVTSVRGSQKSATAVAILVPVLVLGVPLLDTSLAVLRRLWWLRDRGRHTVSPLLFVLRNLREVFMPDRSHIHHRLIEVGVSHRGAVLLIYALGLVFAGVAVASTFAESVAVGTLLLAVLGTSLAAFMLPLYLRARRSRHRAATPIPAEGADGDRPVPVDGTLRARGGRNAAR